MRLLAVEKQDRKTETKGCLKIQFATCGKQLSCSRAVRIPMMPKGVEHLALNSITAPDAWPVRIPMMPKGVEHPLKAA